MRAPAPRIADDAAASYTVRSLQTLLGLPRSVINALVSAGFVTPGRGPRRELRFTFQDVVLMRTAYGLQAASIPARKIVRALERLRERLPETLPLTGLRIAAVGNEVAVWERDAPLQAESGQWLIDFEVRTAPGARAVTRLAGATQTHAGQENEHDDEPPPDWFEHACALESNDPAGAEAAYRQAIAAAPERADAWLNLGCLLCEASRCEEAVEVLRQGLVHVPREALLHFNLGVALEDLHRDDEALATYEACLKLAPGLADAHYNAARLYEAAGRQSRAIRHYNEYRRLQR